jgi:hypothetical protein
VPFLTATAAQRNAWITANADRVQIGKLKSNYSTVFNTAMGNIDNTDDKLTPEAVSLMKRIAIEADPKIAPIRVEERGAKRWYVMYAAARPFRDLKINATIVQAQREVTLAEQNNKLFEGGDIVWDGVIVKEVPDIATVPVSTVGNGHRHRAGLPVRRAGHRRRLRQALALDHQDLRLRRQVRRRHGVDHGGQEDRVRHLALHRHRHAEGQRRCDRLVCRRR